MPPPPDDDPYGLFSGTWEAPKPRKRRPVAAPSARESIPVEADPLPVEPTAATDGAESDYGLFDAVWDESAGTAVDTTALPSTSEPVSGAAPPSQRELRQPTDPLSGLVDDLTGGTIAAMQGLGANALDDLVGYVPEWLGGGETAASQVRDIAKRYPWAHTAGQAGLGIGAGIAAPATVPAQMLAGAGAAGASEYGDSGNLGLSALAGATGAGVALVGGGLGSAASKWFAKPPRTPVQPTVDDLKNAYMAKGGTIDEGAEVALRDLPPDPYREAIKRQAAAAQSAEPPPALPPNHAPAKDPFYGRQGELMQTPPEPPAPPPELVPNYTPAEDPFHGRLGEINRMPPEPPPALVPNAAPAKDPFHNRLGKLMQTPPEPPPPPVPEATLATPSEGVTTGAAFKQPGKGDPLLEELLGYRDLSPGRGWNKKLPLESVEPPARPTWSEYAPLDEAPPLELARVKRAKPAARTWQEPAPEPELEVAWYEQPARPAPEAEPLDLVSRKESALELAFEPPRATPRPWQEPPEPMSLELAVEPTRRMQSGTPAYLDPAFERSVASQAEKQLASLPENPASVMSRIEAGENIGRKLMKAAAFAPGRLGQLARVGDSIAGRSALRNLQIAEGRLVPDQAVADRFLRGASGLTVPAGTGATSLAKKVMGADEVAYADRPAATHALKTALNDPKSGVPEADMAGLTRALLNEDHEKAASEGFRLQSLYPTFQRVYEREMRALQDRE